MSPTSRRVLLAVLQAGTAAALIIDGVVHLRDAMFYGPVRGTLLSEETLFRVQAIAAFAVAGLVLVWPRRAVWAVAVLITGSAFAAVLLYTYVDVGALAGLPDMYEPSWGPPGKLASAVAEGTGMILASAGLTLSVLIARSRRDPLPPRLHDARPEPGATRNHHLVLGPASRRHPTPYRRNGHRP